VEVAKLKKKLFIMHLVENNENKSLNDARGLEIWLYKTNKGSF